ncbi:hypothetical protein CGN00_24070 [Salmonella enterica]|nr:hypothetical protein [Salmonella enterica]EDU3650648.1 hypothetical protein [Salmonella enterica subsp. enterica serovar Tucson]EAM3234638.1 hypothetical protein [Salmonella enterica]EAS2279022.1 hypothetical protein [Salmonella enterica]EAZ8979948.1 hypothetical protein [Salmonella enterica]
MSEFNETQPGNKLYSYLLDDDNKYRLDTLANAVRFILTLCDESKECPALADGMQAKGVTAIFEILDKEIDGIKNSVYATGLEFSPDRIAPSQFGKGR